MKKLTKELKVGDILKLNFNFISYLSKRGDYGISLFGEKKIHKYLEDKGILYGHTHFNMKICNIEKCHKYSKEDESIPKWVDEKDIIYHISTKDEDCPIFVVENETFKWEIL